MWLAIFSCDCFNSVWLYNYMYIVLVIVYHSQSGLPTCKLFIWDCVATHLCSKAAFSSVSLSFSRVTEVRVDCWIVTWVCELPNVTSSALTILLTIPYLQLMSLGLQHHKLLFQTRVFLRKFISLSSHRGEGRFLGCEPSL